MDDYKKKQKHAKSFNGCDCWFCNVFVGKDRHILNRLARRKLKKEDSKMIRDEKGC